MSITCLSRQLFHWDAEMTVCFVHVTSSLDKDFEKHNSDSHLQKQVFVTATTT